MPENDLSTENQRRVRVDTMSEALLQQLDFNGADYFFNSGGTEYAPMWERFAAKQESADEGQDTDLDVQFVGCRHEAVAVQMAMGHAAISGDPQVVGLHANVGPLNAAMSIHGAHRARIPMVLLQSHAETHENERRGGTPGHHYFEFDSLGGSENLLARYLKWMHRPGAVENVPRYVARAFQLARSSPTGPVLLNVAREKLFDESADEIDIYRETPSRLTPSTEDVADVVARLEAASNPMIVTGTVGNDEDVVSNLVELAERTGAPVIEHPKWYHSFPTDHENYLCSEVFVEHYLRKDVDLCLVFGSKRPWYPPVANAPDGDVVVVGAEPTEPKQPYWNYPADALVQADPAAFLARLADRIDDAGDLADAGPVDWAAEHDRLRDYWTSRAERGEGETPIDPFWFCQQLDDLVPDDAIVVQEAITQRPAIVNVMDSKDRLFVAANRLMASGLGGALGIALGTKLAAPDRPLVALVGDGSYSYAPVNAVFGAAQKYDIPLLTIVFDNGGYQSHKQTQRKSYPDGAVVRTENYVGTQFEPGPNYATQIESWDGVGRRITEPDEVVPAVEAGLAAIEDGRLGLVDAVVDDSVLEIEPPG